MGGVDCNVILHTQKGISFTGFMLRSFSDI